MSSFYPYSLQDTGRAKSGINDADALLPPAGTGKGPTMNSRQLQRFGGMAVMVGIALWIIGFFMK